MTQPTEPVETGGVTEAAQAALTAAFAGLVLVALTKFLNRARELVLAPWTAGGSPDPQAILSLDAYWSELVDGLLDDLLRAMRVGWESAARDMGLDIRFDPSNPVLQEQIRATRNLLVNVDAEVYRMVIRAMADGMDRGWSKDRIAERVDDILSVTGTPNWPNRADVIAQTEVGRYMRAGEYAYARTWSARTGRRLVKEWIDRDDDRVRPAHRRADGQVRDLADLFDVGSSRLLYPGHWAGRAADVINERCRMRIREVRRAG